jgi:hypothetical protein
MAFVRNCPALSKFFRDLIWWCFHRPGSVRNFVRIVRCSDNGACPRGASDNLTMSAPEADNFGLVANRAH